MTNEEGTEVFSRLSPIFKDAGAEFWPDGGTLLGLVREDRFLDWDGDVDIGIQAERWNPFLLDAFKRVGFTIRHAPVWNLDWMLKYVGEEARGKTIKVAMNLGSTRVGLHLYRKGVNEYQDRSFYTIYNNRMFNIKNDLLELSPAEFGGISLHVPSYSEDYLAYLYGPSWRIPKPKYIGTHTHKADCKRYTIYE